MSSEDTYSIFVEAQVLVQFLALFEPRLKLLLAGGKAGFRLLTALSFLTGLRFVFFCNLHVIGNRKTGESTFIKEKIETANVKEVNPPASKRISHYCLKNYFFFLKKKRWL